jgi:hypothetical protein
MHYRTISSKFKNLLYVDKFELIFLNINNLLKFQQISIRISFTKNYFVLCFENLFNILNLLEKKKLFFGNLKYIKKILDLCIHKTKFESINVFIKSREISLFYFKKKENIATKQKKNHIVNSKEKFFYFDYLSVNFKDTLNLFLKNFKYTPLDSPLTMSTFFEKKHKKYRIIYKSLESVHQMNSLKNFKKFLIFKKITIFPLIIRNFEFFLSIGSKYLNQLEVSDLIISRIFDFYETSQSSFLFFSLKKPFSNKTTLIIKSNGYIFWKKISSHSFFLCPVQKESSFSRIKILSCGHIFSFKTTIKITETISTMIEFIDIQNKFSNRFFIECPWCETIQEKLYQLNFVLNSYISIFARKKNLKKEEYHRERKTEKSTFSNRKDYFFNIGIKKSYHYSLEYFLH